MLSMSSASNLSSRFRKLAFMTYGKRLQQALQRANKDRAALAKELQVSVQAVGQVITGGRSGTQTFTAENNSKAARFLLVDPHWLATGDGPMVSSAVWPFVSVTPEQLQSLSPKALEAIEKTALSLIEIEQRNVSAPSQADTVVSPRSPGFAGSQKKPKFVKGSSAKRSADPRTARKTGNG
jgi:hypothetical protein